MTTESKDLIEQFEIAKKHFLRTSDAGPLHAARNALAARIEVLEVLEGRQAAEAERLARESKTLPTKRKSRR
jgi:hypothetical protein